MRAIRYAEGWALAAAVALGGAIAGYAFSEYRLSAIVIQLNAEHQGEIKRLQDSNERTLTALTARVQSAAQTATLAGTKAATAADQSAQAAETVKSAAAVVRRRRPVVEVPVSSAAAALPEPARASLNRAVERTNRKIREHK
ncbi:hypothetical protein [Paraburkholderia sp. MM6662-R1]|uniref:hypothetical protein n=1 Tax=Paraburkholderia sp. MM6662-R1 TaxID=2991066 RepID=UPI003D2368B7